MGKIHEFGSALLARPDSKAIACAQISPPAATGKFARS